MQRCLQRPGKCQRMWVNARWDTIGSFNDDTYKMRKRGDPKARGSVLFVLMWQGF
jgi:hypothetical protein